MALFWQHGYEATSMAHLVAATGAKAPTLYAEFTNKEGLFRAVLDRYIAQFSQRHEAELFCPEKRMETALYDFFSAIAACYTSNDTPSGCFIINTSSALAASSEAIACAIKLRHGQQAQTLVRFFELRCEQGEVSAECDIHALSDYLCCILQGMSVSAREGADYASLMQITRTTLRLLPELLKN